MSGESLHEKFYLFFEKENLMKKFAIAAAIIAAATATPALAGTGSAFSSAERCQAAVTAGTATVYEPGMVSSRERVSTPMNGWSSAGYTGPTCVEERVVVNEIDGTRANDKRSVWAWVAIPGDVIVRKGNELADFRCFNQIRQVAARPQVAVRESAQPCVNCDQPVRQPVGQYVQQAQPVGQFVPAATQQVQVSFAPFQAQLPQQTIGLGAFSQPSVAFAAGNTYNTYNTAAPANFGGQTQPPSGGGNDFGGQTNPPAPLPAPVPGPGFGGDTNLPAPLPAPIMGAGNGGNLPGPNNGFGGTDLPAPVGGSIIGAPVSGSGGTVGLPGPVFGGQTNPNNVFSGVTNDTNGNFVGGLGAPVTNGTTIINNGTTVVNGLPNPVGGGTVTNNSFGGFTN